VTIVTYQCRDLVLQCLDSLAEGARRSTIEAIIVDNGSTDGVVEAVRERYPDTSVLAIGRNDGFGRSHNLAVSRANGRYVLVLNPDTVVQPGAIDTMVEFADERERAGDPVGLVAPQLLNPDGTDQRTARAFPTASAGLFGRRSPLTRWFPHNRWSRRFLVSDRVKGDEPWTVDWVSGAAMLIPRNEFEDLGGFDRDFFMHFEDAELCHRIGAAGRAVWCVPRSRIVHDEGGSRGGWTPSQLWYFHRGAYLFARKANYPGPLDPRRWGIGALLGVRLIAAMTLNLVQSVGKPRRTERLVERSA
jgi:GT2 family glycosyltransferase